MCFFRRVSEDVVEESGEGEKGWGSYLYHLNNDRILLFPQSALLHFRIIPSNDQSSITVRMVLFNFHLQALQFCHGIGKGFSNFAIGVC
ncbi:MAG: hypothetical protein ACJAR1_001878 [Rubritalea sp.]|jgi:hypothetical protein